MPSLFASYLRVYEPLTAFDRDRQVFWRRYAREGRALGPVEGPVRQRTAVLEALGAGWTRLPDLPDEAYVLEWGDTLLVCPWNLRLRVAEAALNARDGVPTRAGRRVRAAGAGRAGQGRSWRTGAAGPRCWSTGCRGCTSRSPPGACRCAGSSSSTWTSGRSALDRRPAHAALPHGDLQGPPPGAPGACRCCASRWATRRSPRRSRRAPGGWRSSTRGRSWSWTTAAWSTSSRMTTWREDDSPGLVAAGLSALSRGDADAATEAYEKLVARWRAVQLLERCN